MTAVVGPVRDCFALFSGGGEDAADNGRSLVSRDVSTIPDHFTEFNAHRPSPSVVLIPPATIVAEAIDKLLIARALLRRCEAAGINTWQSRGDRHILRLLHEYRLDGGNLHWIAQTATELANIPAHIRSIAASAKPIAIYNHGTHTDAQWKLGKMNLVRDHCRVMRERTRSVRMFTCSQIPEAFAVKAGERKGCSLQIPTLEGATSAILLTPTNGLASIDDIGLNEHSLRKEFDAEKLLFQITPVPIQALRAGENRFYMFSKTTRRAFEVNWPGPAVLVSYRGKAVKGERATASVVR